MTSKLNMNLIQQIIDERMEKDREKHGAYNSPHEGWAVIEEEFEEAYEELEEVKDRLTYLHYCVRHDLGRKQQILGAEKVYQKSILLAVEALHIAITSKKYAENCEAGANEFGRLEETTPELKNVWSQDEKVSENGAS